MTSEGAAQPEGSWGYNQLAIEFELPKNIKKLQYLL